MAERVALKVCLDAELVGHLWLDDANRLAFDYDEQWRNTGYPIAPSVALQPPPDALTDWQNAATAFFENLLPEGQALDVAAQTLRVSKANRYALLRGLGNEASGAVRIVDPQAPAVPSRLRPVPTDELSERIRNRQDVPFSVWDNTVRLSIAGYQDKLAVLERDGAWYLVDGGDYASTHILKPEPLAPSMAGLTSNEFVCMRLAEAVGLPAAPVRLVHVPEPVLVVERFDRSVKAGGVGRIHVIDACQALGVGPTMKYERPFGDGRDVAEMRNGVRLESLFNLKHYAQTPASFKPHLLRWVIFQVLIHNYDAHAKNISFHWTGWGLSIAPAYDLVNVGIYDAGRVAQSFAMAVGDAFSTEELTAYHWAFMAQECGIAPSQLVKAIVRMAADIEAAFQGVAERAIAEGADQVTVEAVREKTLSQCRVQAQQAVDIPRVPKSAL